MLLHSSDQPRFAQRQVLSLSDDHWYLYPTAALLDSFFSNAARAG
jgi:hypothetical protein